MRSSLFPIPQLPSATFPSWGRQFLSITLDVKIRMMAAFWIFGLINNVSYVIILSAALDLVGPLIPKGLVLVVDVFPSFLVKSIAPYFLIHKVSYPIRIIIMCVLSAGGLLTIALSQQNQIILKLSGVVFASISSGLGEMSLLGLTHFYGPSSLAAWGSGTGAAGIVGAGLYLLLTSILRLSVRSSLLSSATLPFIMPLAFFCVLPQGPLNRKSQMDYAPLLHAPILDEDGTGSHCSDETPHSMPITDNSTNSHSNIVSSHGHNTVPNELSTKIRYLRSLFLPYMLPLLLVYIAEYTINQGITPTLLFPLDKTPFSSYRSFYPTYAFLYQTGVFISRSSLPFFTLNSLYIPSLLQVLNLVLLTMQALYFFLPFVEIIFVITFWEGLLGGAVYVNTFAAIMRNRNGEEREWSLAATTVSDSAGILIAGIIGIFIEPQLCEWNIRYKRPWCQEAGGSS
ncbi:hypothetical protein HI914_06283 [Erysiphe necator]|uniref:Protein BTN n=1 Tax=Uncinula necator TaxID=52586 RepID=A0A0B1P0Z6_UNCNE|nr:hypothetical protein HI914_06283 [Erysiphe necator]KHJ30591.1 putative btn1-like protein [Erysiphe necator]